MPDHITDLTENAQTAGKEWPQVSFCVAASRLGREHGQVTGQGAEQAAGWEVPPENPFLIEGLLFEKSPRDAMRGADMM